MALNNEENILAKNQSKDLNDVILESRFKTSLQLKADEKKHQDDALDTSLTMQEQLLLDLTHQTETTHEKNLEYHKVTSSNQNKVIKNVCFD